MAKRNKIQQNVEQFDKQKFSIVSSDTEYLIPAWCKSVIDFNNEEYIEIEVKERDIWDTDSNVCLDDTNVGACLGDYLNVEKTFCHLCNIHVPLPYVKDHLECSKHLTNRKIAEIGMKRIKNQMTQIYYEEAQPPSIYFCSSCNVMVAEIDKWQHLKSKIHNNALLVDKILNDFLNVYTNDETEMNDEAEHVTVPSRTDADKVATEKTVDVINNNNVEHKNFNACDLKNPLSNNKTATVQSEVEATQDFESLEDFTNYVDANTSNCKLKYLDGFHLKIRTKDALYKVKHENYHGLAAIGKHHVQCKLCKMISRNMKEHMLSTEHLERILLPINTHCIRTLDDTKAHCVLCNDLIEDPDVHVLLNKTHETMLSNALTFDEDDEKVENETAKTQSKASDEAANNKAGALPKTNADKNVQSHHCDAKTCNDSERTETHVKAKAGKATKESKSKALFQSLSSNDWSNYDWSKNHLYNHYQLEHILDDQLKCKVCKITYTVDNIEEHLSSEKHLQNYEALLVANHMKKVKKRIRCQICYVKLLRGKELEHINSSKHINLMPTAKANTDQSLIDKAKDQISGKDYNDKHNKISNTEQTMNPKEKDKFKVNDKEASSAVGKAADVPQTTGESVDPVQFDNVPRKAKSKNKNKAVVSKKNIIQKQIEESGGYEGIDSTEENARYSKLDEDSYQKLCKVCSIIIPDKQMDDIEHVNESYHRNLVTIIEQNRLRLIENMFICEFCHDFIPIGQHFNHMHELSHVHYLTTNKLLDDAGDVDDDKKFNGNCSIINFIQARKYPYYEMMRTQKPDEYKCRVCPFSVPENSSVIKTHVEEKNHKKLLQDILAANLIMEKEDLFNCCICCLRLPKEYLFDHINDGGHKLVLMINRKLKQRLRGTPVCYLCNEVNSAEHRRSTQHKSNAMSMKTNRIVVIEDICFCTSCNIYFTCMNIEKHVSMQYHFIKVI